MLQVRKKLLQELGEEMARGQFKKYFVSKIQNFDPLPPVFVPVPFTFELPPSQKSSETHEFSNKKLMSENRENQFFCRLKR